VRSLPAPRRPGKPLPLVVAAIARELLGFAWAIACQVAFTKAA
jgi:hypothetical protein